MIWSMLQQYGKEWGRATTWFGEHHGTCLYPSPGFVQFRFQQWVLSSPGEIDLWPGLKSSNMLDWMPALPSLISFRNLLLLQCSRPFTWAQLHWQLKDIERISNFPIFTFASLGRVVLSLTVQWTVFTCKEYQTLSTLSWLTAVFHCPDCLLSQEVLPAAGATKDISLTDWGFDQTNWRSLCSENICTYFLSSDGCDSVQFHTKT